MEREGGRTLSKCCLLALHDKIHEGLLRLRKGLQGRAMIRGHSDPQERGKFWHYCLTDFDICGVDEY